MNHPGPEDGQPAASATHRATHAAADEALDVERHGWLGEWVVAGPEAGLPAGAEHRMGKRVEQAVQVAERGALVDHQALDLKELRAVRGVDRFVAVAPPWQEHPDRRLEGPHRVDLAGRGVGP